MLELFNIFNVYVKILMIMEENKTSTYDRSSQSSFPKNIEEEPTNSSKLDSITLDLEEYSPDSFCGSISEGDDSNLIQKIPQMNCLISTQSSLKFSKNVNKSLLFAIKENNLQETLRTLTQFGVKPNSNHK